LRRQKILIVDDEPEIIRSVSGLLEDEGYVTVTAGDGEEGIAKAGESDLALILLDIYMPGMDGLEVLSRITEISPQVPVIMISGQASIENAVKATKMGAVDFVEKPFQPDRLLVSIRNVLEMETLRTENIRLAKELKKQHLMVGESSPMATLREEIARAAPSHGRVLIFGENGTGKELVAAAIHENSPRRAKPFVKLNCAAIPRDLIESELFGHEKGAFTGAVSRKEGRFELADGGSLLLDEIGDMSLDTQAKLLRVLEENEFERLGAKSSIKVDVRVIASTNKDLKAEIKKGNFRDDLYFRVSVIPIQVPPLRDRKDDIPLLVRHFVTLFCEANNRAPKELSEGAMRVLMSHDWPGNVRELKNLVERLVIMTDEATIRGTHIRPFLGEAKITAGDRPLTDMVDEFERSLILGELRRTGWNVSRAAGRLGIDRANLHRKMRRYGIRREDDGSVSGED
jgi:two-component system nitrogen regulation response regulator NtrX